MAIHSFVAIALALANATSSPLAPAEDAALTGLLEQAAAANPEVAQARAAVQLERARIPQAGALPDPSLTLGIQNDGFRRINVGTMETSFLNIMVTQPLYWPGKRGLREQVAQLDARRAEARLARAALDLEARVRRGWLGLLLARGQLDLLAEQERLWTQAEGTARSRYETGQAPQADLLRAQLERARLQSRRWALESGAEVRLAELNRLRVRPLDEPIASAARLAGLPDPELAPEAEVVQDAEARSHLGSIADVQLVQGPSMIRDENGLLAGYVFVDFDTSKVDVGGYVEEAKKAIGSALATPAGYSVSWSGQYENMLRVKERLKLILPLTLILIFALLYLNTKSAFKAALVMLAVPFSAIGAVWLLYALGFNVSIAVWVGMIALMGLDAETGVFMLVFLDLSHDAAKAEGRLRTRGDLVEAIIYGAVKRVRPKAMTVFAAFSGLLPILWSTGAGADVMKRIAAPMVGGLVTSFALELLVYPAVYFLWKKHELTDDLAITDLSPATQTA